MCLCFWGALECFQLLMFSRQIFYISNGLHKKFKAFSCELQCETLFSVDTSGKLGFLCSDTVLKKTKQNWLAPPVVTSTCWKSSQHITVLNSLAIEHHALHNIRKDVNPRTIHNLTELRIQISKRLALKRLMKWIIQSVDQVDSEGSFCIHKFFTLKDCKR